jgi:hypothetical protein
MNRKMGCARATSWRQFAFIPLVAFAPLALADGELEGEPHCPAATIEQARSLANELLDQGVYQRAGECYQAAGEYELANRAFLNAVEPESKTTARQLSNQRDQATSLLRQVQQAFRSRH